MGRDSWWAVGEATLGRGASLLLVKCSPSPHSNTHPLRSHLPDPSKPRASPTLQGAGRTIPCSAQKEKNGKIGKAIDVHRESELPNAEDPWLCSLGKGDQNVLQETELAGAGQGHTPPTGARHALWGKKVTLTKFNSLCLLSSYFIGSNMHSFCCFLFHWCWD